MGLLSLGNLAVFRSRRVSTRVMNTGPLLLTEQVALALRLGSSRYVPESSDHAKSDLMIARKGKCGDYAI